MGWCPRRRCSGECGVHQTSIKPRMGHTTSLALMGPPGWLRCQLWTTPAWLRGFRLLGRCIGQMSYREVSVFGPMRSLLIFGLTPAFRTPVAYEWRSAMEGNARERGRSGEADEPLSDRVRMRRASVFEGEHVVAGVIVGSKELPLVVLSVPPCAERREGRPNKGDRFVGVVGLAACFVPCLAPTTTWLSRMVISPASGSTADQRRPHLATADAGCQFEQE